MILELCDTSLDNSMSEIELNDEPSRYNKSLNPFECAEEEPTTSKSRFSLSDVKFTNMRRLMKSGKREKHTNGLCLKITTSKMRCSIKVKEEFENDASEFSFMTKFVARTELMIYFQAKFI